MQLGRRMDLYKEKDMRSNNKMEQPIKMKSTDDLNEITLPDHITYYHYIYNKKFDTDVYVLNLNSGKLVVAWRGTELSAEDGFDKDDVLQDTKFQKGQSEYPLISSCWWTKPILTSYLSEIGLDKNV